MDGIFGSILVWFVFWIAVAFKYGVIRSIRLGMDKANILYQPLCMFEHMYAVLLLSLSLPAIGVEWVLRKLLKKNAK